MPVSSLAGAARSQRGGSPRDGARSRERSPREIGSRSPRMDQPPQDVDGVKTGLYDVVRDLVTGEIKKNRWSAEVQVHVRRKTLELAAKIESLQKTNTRASTIDKELADLQSGRVPKSCRPFSVTFESPLLEEKLGAKTMPALSLDGDLTLREAKEKAYAYYLTVNKMLDREVLRRQREALRTFTKKECFCVSLQLRYEAPCRKVERVGPRRQR